MDVREITSGTFLCRRGLELMMCGRPDNRNLRWNIFLIDITNRLFIDNDNDLSIIITITITSTIKSLLDCGHTLLCFCITVDDNDMRGSILTSYANSSWLGSNFYRPENVRVYYLRKIVHHKTWTVDMTNLTIRKYTCSDVLFRTGQYIKRHFHMIEDLAWTTNMLW